MRTWGIRRLAAEPRRPADGMGEVTLERRILTPEGKGEESDLYIVDLESRTVHRASRSPLARSLTGQHRNASYLYQHVSHLRGDLPVGTILLREQRDYGRFRTLVRTTYCVGALLDMGALARVAWDLGEHHSVTATGWTRVHVLSRQGTTYTLIEDCASATAVLP